MIYISLLLRLQLLFTLCLCVLSNNELQDSPNIKITKTITITESFIANNKQATDDGVTTLIRRTIVKIEDPKMTRTIVKRNNNNVQKRNIYTTTSTITVPSIVTVTSRPSSDIYLTYYPNANVFVALPSSFVAFPLTFQFVSEGQLSLLNYPSAPGFLGAKITGSIQSFGLLSAVSSDAISVIKSSFTIDSASRLGWQNDFFDNTSNQATFCTISPSAVIQVMYTSQLPFSCTPVDIVVITGPPVLATATTSAAGSSGSAD